MTDQTTTPDAQDAHEGMTRMLFVDAIFGVGFPSQAAAIVAVEQKLARYTGNQHIEAWMWDREALEALPIPLLQDLYTSLKMYEVTHAG